MSCPFLEPLSMIGTGAPMMVEEVRWAVLFVASLLCPWTFLGNVNGTERPPVGAWQD